ncbi:hypothetical protein KQI84_08745 [bacterium]|nr:hypothetical protein [bacterium]
MEVCAVEWLPDPEVVMARSKAAAAADALLSADPDLRQYRCNVQRPDGTELAWRHDGAGSYYYVLKDGDSMAIKACALRMSMGPDPLARFQREPDVEMPDVALRLLREPEFRYQEMSFLAWSEGGQPWQGLLFRVDNVSSLDMGKPLLELVHVGPKTFYLYAQSYHEVTPDPPTLKAMFSLQLMDDQLAQSLPAERKLANARKDLEEIGYPLM